MALAADDADAIRASQVRIPYEVTTDPETSICPTCNGMGFLFGNDKIGGYAKACPDCLRKPNVILPSVTP